jgi:hypothetical protein
MKLNPKQTKYQRIKLKINKIKKKQSIV